MKLVLASSSRYRRELLAKLRLPFECAAPDIDETPLPDETAAATSSRLARAKAMALQPRFPDALIIGSDQVALLDGVQLGKPGDHARARLQLQAMRGKSLCFHTALCLYNAATGTCHEAIDETHVDMRAYSDEEIERYLEAEQPYDCAGSAKSEGYGITLIAAIRGDDPNALIGLPLIRLLALLRREGVVLP